MIRTLRTDTRDAGFTLAELLVYMLLLSLVLVGIGTVIIRSVRGQQQVVAVSQAASDAQVAVQAIDRGVRNAAVGGVKVAPHVLVTHSGGGDAAGTFVCQAWVYVKPTAGATFGSLWTRTLPASSSRPAADRLDARGATLAAGGATTGWTRLVNGVVPQAGGATGAVFSGTVPTVTTQFSTVQTEGAGANKPGTKVGATVTSRLQAVSGNGGCFS